MVRLIDADAIEHCLVVGGRRHGKTIISEIIRRAIQTAPTVDAVPVIRCRDCKFLRFTGTVWKCQNRLVMMLCEPDDFCSRAERKEE